MLKDQPLPDDIREALIDLHRQMIDEFLSRLKSGQRVPAGLLKEIRSFLRDNGVTQQTINDANQAIDYRDSPFGDDGPPF